MNPRTGWKRERKQVEQTRLLQYFRFKIVADERDQVVKYSMF